MSLICSTSSTSTLESINGRGLVISPQRWRAFVINVVGSAVEFPGAVHYLADSLSQEGLSILHISTFESEVFLVQEQDIEKACTVFRKSESPIEIASLIQEAQRKRTLSGNTTNFMLHSAENTENTENGDSFYVGDADISTLPPFKEGFELCVLPGHVMLARLNDDFPLSECSEILVRMIFLSFTLLFFVFIFYFAILFSPAVCPYHSASSILKIHGHAYCILHSDIACGRYM